MTTASDHNSMPLPQEVDEDEFQSGGNIITLDTSSAKAKKSLMSFFVVSATLFGLVEEFLITFSSDDAAAISPQVALNHYFAGPSTVFDTDKKMMDWQVKMPIHLQLNHPRNAEVNASEHVSAYHRQAVVIHSR